MGILTQKPFEVILASMKYIVMILLQSVIFAMIDVFAKIAYRTVTVAPFMTLRFAVAVLGSFLVYGKKVIDDFKNVSVKHYIVPALCMGLSINLSNIAIRLTTVTTYSFVRNMSALIAPLLLCIFFHRKYRWYDFVLQISLVTGLYLLCAKGGLSKFGLGEVFAIGTATLIAVSLVFGQDALKYVHSETLSTAQLIAGLLFTFPMGIISGEYFTSDWSLFLTNNVWAIVLFNALIGTLIGYQLQNLAMEHISSKVVGIVQSFYPVCTATLSAIMLGELPNIYGIIGAIIITGVVVFQAILRK